MALLVAAALVALAPLAAAQTSAVLDGTVAQGTAGGGPISGLTVRLLVFQNKQKVDEREATTDEQGRFRFEGLDPDPSRIYFPVVDYQGVSYYPSPVTFKDSSTQSVQITVYESTSSDAQISLPRANLILTGVVPERLYLMEMGVVANNGDRAYSAPETVRLALPRGVEAFTPRFGVFASAVNLRPEGFVLTGPILPGEHELAFSYELPVQGREASLSRRLEYPVQAFQLFVPADQGIEVQSPQLSESGTRDLGGQRFRVYTATSLPRGAVLDIQLRNLPQAPGLLAQRVGYALLAGGLALGLGSLLVAWRRGSRRLAPAAADPASESERLLRELAELDERFEAGELGETAYRRARDLHKRRLVALVRESSELRVPSSESDGASSEFRIPSPDLNGDVERAPGASTPPRA